jgi:hypothetical protein
MWHGHASDMLPPEFVRQVNSILTPRGNGIRNERTPVTRELGPDPSRGGCRSAGRYEALLKRRLCSAQRGHGYGQGSGLHDVNTAPRASRTPLE